MGVKGLLPTLQSITRNISLEKYRGLTVAVDAMCWLHKGVFSVDVPVLAKYQFEVAAQNEANENMMEDDDYESGSKQSPLPNTVDEPKTLTKRLNFDRYATVKKKARREKTNTVVYGPSVDAKMAMVKCADYVIRHAERISKEFGIELVLVIDGDDLPCKQSVNDKRREDRAAAYQKGLQFERRGDSQEARKHFAKACSISHEVRRELILQCQTKQIRFVVAPYEADAQLADLSHRGVVDAVISEDSDLLAYGCPRVLFKLDMKTLRGDEIQIMKDLASNTSLSFRNWNQDMFVHMCILAGCDYFEGVPGVGIQTAHKLVRVNRSPHKIFNALRMTGKLPRGFEEAFWVAYRTFRHQRVYCTNEQIVRPLFPIQEQLRSNEEWNFLGPAMESSLAISIATGVIHPRKHLSWKEIEAKRVPYTTNTRNHQRNPPLVTDKKTATRKKSSSDMFAFFNKGSKEKSQAVQNRVPLGEISFNPNKITQQVATTANGYKSKLVGSAFKPLSRKSNARRDSARQGASAAFLKMKRKLSYKKNMSSLQMVMEQEKTKLQARCDFYRNNPSVTSSHQGGSESGGLNFLKSKSFDPSYTNEANCRLSEYDYQSATGAGSYGSFDYGPLPDIDVDEELLNFNNLSVEDNDCGGTSRQDTWNACKYEEGEVGVFQGSHDNEFHQYTEGIWDNRIDEQWVSSQHNLPVISNNQKKNHQQYQEVDEHSYHAKGSNQSSAHPYYNRCDSNKVNEFGDYVQDFDDQTYVRESPYHDLNDYSSYDYETYPKESSTNQSKTSQLRFCPQNDRHDHSEGTVFDYGSQMYQQPTEFQEDYSFADYGNVNEQF